jgi:hypothetical protein
LNSYGWLLILPFTGCWLHIFIFEGNRSAFIFLRFYYFNIFLFSLNSKKKETLEHQIMDGSFTLLDDSLSPPAVFLVFAS